MTQFLGKDSRSLKVNTVLLACPHSVYFVSCAVDSITSAMYPNILNDVLALFWSGRVFGNVKLPLARVSLMRVITGLVLSGMVARGCGSLLEDSIHAQRSW